MHERPGTVIGVARWRPGRKSEKPDSLKDTATFAAGPNALRRPRLSMFRSAIDNGWFFFFRKLESCSQNHVASEYLWNRGIRP